MALAVPLQSLRRAAHVVVAVMAATLLVSCSHGDSAAAIAIGAGDSAQSELIAELYAGALARTGVHTIVRSQLGRRGDYLSALDADRVVLVGDESGDLLTAFDAGSAARFPDPTAASDSEASDSSATSTAPSSAATSVPSVSDSLSRALPEGLAISDIADGTDLRPEFVFSKAAATRFPSSLTDLAPRCGALSVGIATGHELDPLRRPPDPRRDVLDPLRSVYGCDITHYTVFPNDSALQSALRSGRVQAGVLTAPAALLTGGVGDLVTVADPEYAFRAQNVVPLFRQGSLSDVQIKKLNYVAGELTTDDFTTMIRKLRDEHAKPADLARDWLDLHSL
ncbi:glycine betaine ABC transporter substrate-binding protein [Nocardia alni]|uniref:glycine betaine ABC transporter substrate-binding protein n=1 Tax=Nocardia alni TaxID=2815723 RepID=UPI001C22EC80|nr:glycine betaine ABC transporter substrate-binding protein [Nocardia alni]